MTVQAKTVVKKKDEKILVVPARTLLHEPIVGFHPLNDFSSYADVIDKHKKFLWRSQMEVDPTYKQIIPYLIFSHDKKYFLMKRKGSASEQRLKNKYSLGIGGHIREEDVCSNNIIDWARREFHEEINYQGNLVIHPLGIINDESNPVGQVHTGFAFLLEGDNPNISIKSELQSGELVSLKDCLRSFSDMETWSQLVCEFLEKKYQ